MRARLARKASCSDLILSILIYLPFTTVYFCAERERRRPLFFRYAIYCSGKSTRREPRRRIRLGIDQQKDYYLHNNRNNRLEQFCTQNCCKFFEQIAIIELRISVVCRSLDCSVGIGSAKVVRGKGHRSRGLGRSRKSGLHFTFACSRI